MLAGLPRRIVQAYLPRVWKDPYLIRLPLSSRRHARGFFPRIVAARSQAMSQFLILAIPLSNMNGKLGGAERSALAAANIGILRAAVKTITVGSTATICVAGTSWSAIRNSHSLLRLGIRQW